MPLLNLSFPIPGERYTAIIEKTVRELGESIDAISASAYSDGIFPGTKSLPGPVRLGQYLDNTDIQDLGRLTTGLFDDGYLERIAAGLDAPPVSPYWLRQMSLRDSFDRNRKDFQRLLTQSEGRRERFR